ncbi:hypothetical protein AXF42_Ash009959 [Apostasia shenzhenica]|uniref:Uncharacterized protein n=1 Tax=Apostasia shenzhenica TaxID=1088818 RepID=A0A2I0ACH5_9ASPA|nr:hypothetical protein AXF42_Ash009959 [Apostasia shenzhenica]
MWRLFTRSSILDGVLLAFTVTPEKAANFILGKLLNNWARGIPSPGFVLGTPVRFSWTRRSLEATQRMSNLLRRLKMP